MASGSWFQSVLALTETKKKVCPCLKDCSVKQNVETDDFVFKLHYKITFISLLVCTLLVTIKQYVQDPIYCIVDGVPLPLMDTYCWIYSTFTVTNNFDERVGKDVVQPGVSIHNNQTPIKRHKYYQWVGFVLFFQAMLFYFPHYLWKTWEAKTVKALVGGLKFKLSQESEKEDLDSIGVISEYYNKCKGENNWIARKYFICEFLNWLNVTLQVILVDFFLDWEFTSYGWKIFEIINLDPDNRSDPLASVFPKVTKCTFNKYGPTGTLQNFDGLCILPVNIINEKIYLFLWFWMAFLFMISSFGLVDRILWLRWTDKRSKNITSKCLFDEAGTKLYFPENSEPQDSLTLSLEKRVIEIWCKKINYGDAFFLSLIGRNTDALIFNKILYQIIKRKKTTLQEEDGAKSPPKKSIFEPSDSKIISAPRETNLFFGKKKTGIKRLCRPRKCNI